MEDILKKAKIKRAELMMVIGTMIDYYTERSKIYSKRADRFKYFAVAMSLVGLLMLGTFVVKCDGSARWIAFGVVSVAFMLVGAVVVAFFEKRYERAGECLDRIGELHEFADYIRHDPISEQNAQARKQWYTVRIGILKCEYLHSKRTLGGGLEFEELAAPMDVRSNKLLDTIADLGTTIAIADLSTDTANAVADGISEVVKGLAD